MMLNKFNLYVIFYTIDHIIIYKYKCIHNMYYIYVLHIHITYIQCILYIYIYIYIYICMYILNVINYNSIKILYIS